MAHESRFERRQRSLLKNVELSKQVLANKDASPFLCCFVAVVEVVIVVNVVVVAVVWVHMNIINNSRSFLISRNRQNIVF